MYQTIQAINTTTYALYNIQYIEYYSIELIIPSHSHTQR